MAACLSLSLILKGKLSHYFLQFKFYKLIVTITIAGKNVIIPCYPFLVIEWTWRFLFNFHSVEFMLFLGYPHHLVYHLFLLKQRSYIVLMSDNFIFCTCINAFCCSFFLPTNGRMPYILDLKPQHSRRTCPPNSSLKNPGISFLLSSKFG